jgi:ubiquinone/menaquinone biosynthesis C-methylase UbiE
VRAEPQPVENREVHRVPVRLLVSSGAGSVALGQTRDLSLEGFFLAMDRPPPPGSELPVALALPDGQGPLMVRARVARHTDGGAGLHFVKLDTPQRRRLRRVVGELTAAEGTRATVRAANAESDEGQALDGAGAQELLEQAVAAGAEVTLIPSDRAERLGARLVARHDDGGLELSLGEPGSVRAGEAVLVLLTINFVSWSFDSRVREAKSSRVLLPPVHLLNCSERRSTDRIDVAADTELVVPRPWFPGHELRFAVCERSPGGLSFRADPETCSFVPGAALEGASLRSLAGGSEALESAVVKHLTLVEPEEGPPWVKIGLAYGVRRQPVQRSTAETTSGRFSMIAGQIADLVSGAWHRIARTEEEEATAVQVVRFPNRRGQELVGLLNRTSLDEGRLVAPLVILFPGYGHRKERLSGLTTTLIDGFARQGHPLAVLRVDGTNNLGESAKDAGCGVDGRHTRNYTISGAVDDLLGCLDWARANPWFEPLDVIVVSQSFGSIAVRHALARRDTSDVGLWISYMGAADAQDAILHVSGHVDILGNHRAGVPNGPVTLAGCMVDADHFCADAVAIKASNLDDARRDLGAIGADVVWIVGEADAWMDPRRVEDVMSVATAAEREVLTFEGGHLPASGAIAARQFQAVASRVHRWLHRSPLPVRPPLAGRLIAAAEPEWARVRRPDVEDRTQFWRSYLLGEGTLGFDVLALAPPYRDFLRAEVDALEPEGARVLDLGAGTGNGLCEIQERGPLELVGVDLVPEALARARERLPDSVRLQALDIDGNARTAIARWLRGELAGLSALGRRIPGVHTRFMKELEEVNNPALHAALRGAEVDAHQAARSAGLSEADSLFFEEIATLSRVAVGRIPRSEGLRQLNRLPPEALPDEGGLPFRDGRFDRVLLSLVLSYLRHPADCLSEVRRVLAPGGRLVVSSMKRGSDMSKLFLDLVRTLQTCDAALLPPGADRGELLGSARRFADSAAHLYRLEEEGLFQFHSAEGLLDLVSEAGFVEPVVTTSFGDPAQAIIVQCRRP